MRLPSVLNDMGIHKPLRIYDTPHMTHVYSSSYDVHKQLRIYDTHTHTNLNLNPKSGGAALKVLAGARRSLKST